MIISHPSGELETQSKIQDKTKPIPPAKGQLEQPVASPEDPEVDAAGKKKDGERQKRGIREKKLAARLVFEPNKPKTTRSKE